MSSVVSVVVTCHNLEKYIGQAIESVLEQDHVGDVEILVIDDVSSDASADIVKSYPGVRYLRTPQNLGVLMATVLGIRETTGDLVFFLDGDDIWNKEKLSLALAKYEEDPRLGFLTHDLEYIDGSGASLPLASRPREVMGSGTGDNDKLIRDCILMHLDYVWLGSAHSIRRSLIDAEGFCRWAEHLPHPFDTYQDWPLAFWAATRADVRMGYLAAPLFKYRVHGANHSGDASSAGKALRNFRRTYNTMLAMHEISVAVDLDPGFMRATDQKTAYCHYLVELYSGRRWNATRGFLASARYLLFGRVGIGKEITRFLGVQILGVRRFVVHSGRVKKWISHQ